MNGPNHKRVKGGAQEASSERQQGEALPSNRRAEPDTDLSDEAFPQISPASLHGQLSELESVQAPSSERRSNFALRALDRFGSDPTARTGIVRLLARIGIDFIPFVAPLKKIADARAQFKTGDESKAQELALIGSAELLLDSLTLGASALIPDEILTVLRTVKDAGSKVKDRGGLFRFLPIPDPLGFCARQLLKIPPLRKVTRAFLKA